MLADAVSEVVKSQSQNYIHEDEDTSTNLDIFPPVLCDHPVSFLAHVLASMATGYRDPTVTFEYYLASTIDQRIEEAVAVLSRWTSRLIPPGRNPMCELEKRGPEAKDFVLTHFPRSVDAILRIAR